MRESVREAGAADSHAVVRKDVGQYGHELWFGDAAEIRAAMVRKQKTDTRDARHILDLLIQDRFPRKREDEKGTTNRSVISCIYLRHSRDC